MISKIGRLSLWVALSAYILPFVVGLLIHYYFKIFEQSSSQQLNEGQIVIFLIGCLISCSLGVVAAILGVLSVVKKNENPWFGVTGLILGLLPISFAAVVYLTTLPSYLIN